MESIYLAQLLSYHIHKFVDLSLLLFFSLFELLSLLSLLLDKLVNLGSQLCGIIVEPLLSLLALFSLQPSLFHELFILLLLCSRMRGCQHEYWTSPRMT